MTGVFYLTIQTLIHLLLLVFINIYSLLLHYMLYISYINETFVTMRKLI